MCLVIVSSSRLGKGKIKLCLGWEDVYCVEMGYDGCVIGDENLGFIIRRHFVTNNISCTVVFI
jgi:hypothetical protein